MCPFQGQIKSTGKARRNESIEKARCALPFAPGFFKMAEWFSPTTKFVNLFSIIENRQEHFLFQFDLKFLAALDPDILAFSQKCDTRSRSGSDACPDRDCATRL